MFRTELPLTPHPQQLPLSARVLTIGSCFSDSIGSRLAADKVATLVNPFGTVFNPLAACRLLRAAAGEEQDWQQHVVEARGRWQSLDLHATHGADSPVELLQQTQQLLRDTGVFVATADVVVLTLGSAWVYRYKETGELVSNCHKLPAEKFEKELLTPDEIINTVAETHAYLRLHNPKLRFVLTVSPVRHAKDTLPLNAVSKSVLRVACHYLSELLPDVSYFPAYELLLDDLRDYRFYAEDMLHPSKVAEDYIWERFARTYFDAGFGRFRKEWEAVRQALSHRPLHAAAPEHRQFLESTLAKLERLASQTDVRMELLEVRHQLQNLPLPVAKPEPELEDDGEERIDIGAYAAPARAQAAAPAPVAAEEVEEFEEFESVRGDDTAAPDVLAVDDEDAEDDDAATAESDAADVLDALAPKKKRRSRGGAKRNKKKHAARLAAELAAAEGSALPAEQAVAPTPLPAAPAVSVMADPEMAPQTALERRKRNSRRGRGRGQNAAQATDNTEAMVTVDAPEELLPAAATEPTSIEPAPTSAAVPQEQPAIQLTEATAPATNQEPEEADAAQRPARTGRSASEKRADALRKPHRGGARQKPLYAGEPAPESPEPAASVPAPEPAPKAAPAIPVTVGTGASGRLTESGKATLSARSAAVPAPALSPLPAAPVAAEAPEPARTPAPAAEATSSAPAAIAAVPKARRAPARKAKVTPAAVPAPDVSAAAAPSQEAAAEAPATPESAAPSATKPKAARPPRKAKPAPAAPQAPEPVTEAVVAPAAPASKPAKPARQAAAKKPTAPKAPAAKKAAPAKKVAPAAKPEPADKPARPPRKKPAKPDTPPENA
ncbi:GSCFA domain-containing protein [Hymenobacter sp. APR13]|uniref:GSCFA domain-containing protein n=1 Tax=Hymenobacter sp. APR13 TaxID=1356852 RepID=UPI0004E04234|nr:GSCFA domain-containing protein [Hymenobacter sp. APR13]AII52960.1 hypothetical protein N008_13365 [Hymenobacter sp. APR13]